MTTYVQRGDTFKKLTVENIRINWVVKVWDFLKCWKMHFITHLHLSTGLFCKLFEVVPLHYSAAQFLGR